MQRAASGYCKRCRRILLRLQSADGSRQTFLKARLIQANIGGSYQLRILVLYAEWKGKNDFFAFCFNILLCT